MATIYHAPSISDLGHSEVALSKTIDGLIGDGSDYGPIIGGDMDYDVTSIYSTQSGTPLSLDSPHEYAVSTQKYDGTKVIIRESTFEFTTVDAVIDYIFGSHGTVDQKQFFKSAIEEKCNRQFKTFILHVQPQQATAALDADSAPNYRIAIRLKGVSNLYFDHPSEALEHLKTVTDAEKKNYILQSLQVFFFGFCCCLCCCCALFLLLLLF
jgi:hypothetical protein